MLLLHRMPEHQSKAKRIKNSSLGKNNIFEESWYLVYRSKKSFYNRTESKTTTASGSKRFDEYYSAGGTDSVRKSCSVISSSAGRKKELAKTWW